MNISPTSSSDVEVLSLHRWAQRNLGDRDLILSLGGLYSWRSDVCSSSTSGAESSVAVIANDALADNFAITIASN